MHKITIGCTALSPAQLHAVLAEQMDFPAWYGHNLDALYDCLTDLDKPTHLVLQNLQEESFRQTLVDASLACSDLTVTFEA